MKVPLYTSGIPLPETCRSGSRIPAGHRPGSDPGIQETGAEYRGPLTLESLDAEEAQLVPLENHVNPGMAIAVFHLGKPQCLNARLSPDGRHTLPLVTEDWEYAFQLPDTQTLALLRVRAPCKVASPFAAWNGAVNKHYTGGHTWASDSRTAICAANGVRLFEITAPQTSLGSASPEK